MEIGEATAPGLPPSWRQALLFLTYVVSMFGVNSAGAVYPAIEAEHLLDAATAARLIGVQTAGTALGKVFAGPVTDALGGRRTYMFCISLLGTAVFLISLSSTPILIGTFAFLMEFVNTPIWPAHARIVKGWYHPDRVSDAFWLLGIGSRGGNLLCNLIYGGLISAGMGWRWVLRVACFSCVIGGFISRLHSDTPTKKDSPGLDRMDVKEMVRRGILVLKHRHFWIAASSLAFATVTKRMGQIVPLYLFTTTALREGEATSVSVVFQLGLLMSVGIPGYFYGRSRSDGRKINMLLGLNMLSAGSAFILFLVSAATPVATSTGDIALRSILLFLIAFGIGCSYYIPCGIFSVRFGGDKFTGAVSSFMDMVSWMFASIFITLVMPWIIDSMGWPSVWALIALTSAICSFTTWKFTTLLYADGAVSALKDFEEEAHYVELAVNDEMSEKPTEDWGDNFTEFDDEDRGVAIVDAERRT